jgi:hypothetical protein
MCQLIEQDDDGYMLCAECGEWVEAPCEEEEYYDE